MYDVTSTNGHSEDYYQVPLKKNLKLERRKNNNTTFNTQEKWRKYDGEKEIVKQRMASEGGKVFGWALQILFRLKFIKLRRN